MSGELWLTGVDVFRLIAAALVIAIHTSPLESFTATGDFLLTSVLARCAVPFFFTASGYFMVTRYAKDVGRLWRFERRTLLLYLAAAVMYIPVMIYKGDFAGHEVFIRLLRGIFIEGTMYHLWYLPAAMTGGAMAWYLVRRHGYPAAFAVTGALYMLGVLGDSWYDLSELIPPLRWFYGEVFTLTSGTRCGLFFPGLYFVLGGWLRERGSGQKRGRSALGLGLSLAAMALEALLLRRAGWGRRYTMYFALPAVSLFLFSFLLTFHGRRLRCRGAALAAYIIHPMVLIALRAAARLTGLWEALVENSLLRFLAVSALTWAVSIPAAVICDRLRHKEGPAGTRRAWRELDLDALRHNAGELLRLCGPGREIMAVVKANAYGHGDFETAAELERAGVRAFAVASVDEGVRLRRYGIRGEILILGYTDAEYAGTLGKYRLTQTVVSPEHARELGRRGVRLRVHVKIDTGMNRLGTRWDDLEALRGIFEMKNLKITGVFTHLSRSEGTGREDAEFSALQGERFEQAVKGLERMGFRVPCRHIQSTYGLLNASVPEEGCCRAGLGIYGVLSAPGEKTARRADLRPALSLRARVALVREVHPGECVGYGREFTAKRESRIAILPIGYADGYPRSLSKGAGHVLIGGMAAPVVGSVCMDQLAVDVTDIPDVRPGDTATLIGVDGESMIRAEDLAESAGTITNELLSRLGPRLPIVTCHGGAGAKDSWK